MKLRQREWCHNCNQEVIFEFDDINERQVINCPNCGHEHYRELDDATILDIRIDQTRGTGQFQTLRVAKMPEVSFLSCDADPSIMGPIMDMKEYKIVGQDADGRAILDGGPISDGYMEGNKTKRITDRRWGRDPSQRG